jgi:hypothetical protein
MGYQDGTNEEEDKNEDNYDEYLDNTLQEGGEVEVASLHINAVHLN